MADDSGCEMSGDLNTQLSLHQQEVQFDSRAKFVNVGSSAMNSCQSYSTSQTSRSRRSKEYFDIVLVCSAHAGQQRNTFITFCEKQQWKVYLPSREKIAGEDEFSSFERGHRLSTYIVILLTPCFKEDVWAVRRFQIALKMAIEERRSNVIPVLYGLDSKMVPFELIAIANIKHDDEFFEHVMKRTIDTNVRTQRQHQYDQSCMQVAVRQENDNDDVSMDYDLESVDSATASYANCGRSSSYAESFSLMFEEFIPASNSARFLKPRLFNDLCMNLDIPSPNFNGDWRGLAVLLELGNDQIKYLESSSMKSGFSAAKKLLDAYFHCNKNLDKHSGLKKLQGIFKEMDYGKGIRILQESLES